ncbi:MAG: preprotein translocase subunit SecE [Saprospiraceae bacterium]|jgi:preprotein translocase subunit SecE
MEQIKLYVRESYNELLHKVTWPTWPSLQKTTVSVIVASVVISLVVFLMDVASKQVTSLIYDL